MLTEPKTWAFKEWAAIVLALERGIQDVIFRRGGIAEDGDVFEPPVDGDPRRELLLLPTYFHQQKNGLTSAHAELVEEAFASEPPAGLVRITSRARVRSVEPVPERETLERWSGRHVYATEVLEERLTARRGRALYALEVDVERLPEPLLLPDTAELRGCRSWVDVTELVGGSPRACR